MSKVKPGRAYQLPDGTPVTVWSLAPAIKKDDDPQAAKAWSEAATGQRDWVFLTDGRRTWHAVVDTVSSVARYATPVAFSRGGAA